MILSNCKALTLSMLEKKESADDRLHFFPVNRIRNFMLPQLEKSRMKCPIVFSGNKNIYLSSSELAHRGERLGVCVCAGAGGGYLGKKIGRGVLLEL